MAVQPIQPGYHSIIIHLCFKDTKKAIAFYARAFGAEQTMMMPGPGGSVMHAEIRIGDTVLFLADDMMQLNATVDGGQGTAFIPHLAVADAEPRGSAPSTLAAKRSCRSPIRSGATAMARSSILSACAGRSSPTSRTCRSRRSASAPPGCSAAAESKRISRSEPVGPDGLSRATALPRSRARTPGVLACLRASSPSRRAGERPSRPATRADARDPRRDHGSCGR